MTKPAGKGLFHTLVFFGHHSLIECVFVTFLISSPSYSSFIALKKIDKKSMIMQHFKEVYYFITIQHKSFQTCHAKLFLGPIRRIFADFHLQIIKTKKNFSPQMLLMVLKDANCRQARNGIFFNL